MADSPTPRHHRVAAAAAVLATHAAIRRLRSARRQPPAPATAEQQRRLARVINRLCGDMDLPYPVAQVIPGDLPNMTVRVTADGTWSLLCTTALVELASDRELRACAAHELCHLVRGEARWTVPLRTAVRAAGRGADVAIADSLIRNHRLDRLAVAAAVVGIASHLGLAASGRHAELSADLGALQLGADIDALVSVLGKIEQATPRRLEGMRQNTWGHPLIHQLVNLVGRSLDAAVSPTPTAAARIAALERYDQGLT